MVTEWNSLRISWCMFPIKYLTLCILGWKENCKINEGYQNRWFGFDRKRWFLILYISTFLDSSKAKLINWISLSINIKRKILYISLAQYCPQRWFICICTRITQLIIIRWSESIWYQECNLKRIIYPHDKISNLFCFNWLKIKSIGS